MMKRTAVTVNISRMINGVGMAGRIFLTLSFITLCFFLILGVISVAQSRLAISPAASMKGMAASVSSHFFADMIGMELPNFNRDDKEFTFSQKNVSGFLFQFLTSVNPRDPKSLLARELPGMGEDTFLLRSGLATDPSFYPVDYTPSLDSLIPEPDVQNPGEEEAVPNPADPDPDKDIDENTGSQTALSTHGKKVVFIYHSHNRESWVPELKNKGVTNINDAYDPKINVTMLGKRLAAKLEQRGVGAVGTAKDYPTVIKDFNYNYSYKYSLQTVKEAFATNPDYLYFFDVHRDSLERKLTTVNIGGKDYAQVYFIIGHRNENWKKNEQFASKIHERLEQEYPGLSRGMWGKSSKNGNGEYNQSFSPNSILIEVGGPENTLAECNRTIDILAEVIADTYFNAVKVNTSVNAKQANGKKVG